MPLPPGFTLDSPSPSPSSTRGVRLPPGFTLDTPSSTSTPAPAADPGFFSNVASSAENAAKGVWSAATHPINTALNIAGLASATPLDLATGGVNNAAVKQLETHFASRYGSLDAAKKTAWHDPVGFAMDALNAFGPVADASGLSGAASDTATGAVNMASDMAKGAGTLATEVASKIPDAVTNVMSHPLMPILGKQLGKMALDFIPGGGLIRSGIDAMDTINKLKKAFPDVAAEATPVTPTPTAPVPTQVSANVRIPNTVSVESSAGKGVRTADTLDADTQTALAKAAQSGKLSSLPASQKAALVQSVKAGDSAGVQNIIGTHSAVDNVLQAVQAKVNTLVSYAKARGIDPNSITEADARNAFANAAHSHGAANGMSVPKQGYRGISDSTWQLVTDALKGSN